MNGDSLRFALDGPPFRGVFWANLLVELDHTGDITDDKQSIMTMSLGEDQAYHGLENYVNL